MLLQMIYAIYKSVKINEKNKFSVTAHAKNTVNSAIFTSAMKSILHISFARSTSYGVP